MRHLQKQQEKVSNKGSLKETSSTKDKRNSKNVRIKSYKKPNLNQTFLSNPKLTRTLTEWLIKALKRDL